MLFTAAIERGDVEEVRDLCRCGALAMPNELAFAASRGYLTMVNMILEAQRFIPTDLRGALHIAVIRGYANVVRQLRSHGAVTTPRLIALAQSLSHVHVVNVLNLSIPRIESA